MMKMWSRLIFLVLAISSVSGGENKTVPQHGEGDTSKEGSPELLTTTTPQPLSPGETHKEATSQAQPTPSSAPTPQEETHLTSPEATPVKTTEGSASSSAPQTTAGVLLGKKDVHGDGATVPMATTTSTSSTTGKPSVHSSWGYVILVLIILVIIALCTILYFLRRVSRTYSFDLQRPSPVNNHNEPTGTFEAVYLDDLDRPALKNQEPTDDLSPPPVANGTTLQSEEKGSNGDAAPQEQSDANGLQSSPTSNTSNTSLSLGDDPADKASSPLSSTVLLFDAVGKEQQNENNNNPSLCSGDPFVDINLDEPAWCDQLLTSPEAPSSVLPFSPFSFSSSSS